MDIERKVYSAEFKREAIKQLENPKGGPVGVGIVKLS